MGKLLDQIPGWQAYLVALIGIVLWIRERWFKAQNDKISTDNSTLVYQGNQIEELKKIIAIKDDEAKKSSEANRTRTESLGRELSTLQGQLIEKDKQAKAYLDILQNRDPKMEQLIAQVATALTDIHSFMQAYIKNNPAK